MSQFSTRFISFVILSFAMITFAHANPSLKEALEQGKQVAIFNVNDAFTDADSIQSFMDSLLLGAKYKDLITQYFVTDDEVDKSTYLQVVKEINEKTCFADENDAPLRAHYQQDVMSTSPQFGFRVQDTAVVLFPIADKLGVPITIIQGELSFNPTYNPYFGNFGMQYGHEENKYINRIHKRKGSSAVIEAMQKEMSEGKLIYVLNGGSFRLLSDIQERAPSLVSKIDITMMGFRQPMNFPPFTDPHRKWRPSWNQGINWASTIKFMNYSSNPAKVYWKRIRIVDSNTVEYAMVCNGEMYPTYETQVMNLAHLLSKASLKNLLDAENRHEVWSGFKTKLSDSVMVFDAYGRIYIPRSTSRIIESMKDYNIRVNPDIGFESDIPMLNGEHPFSHPRVVTDNSYQGQIERVQVLRSQIKAAHQESDEMIPD